jgi:hypothetical protein
LGRWQRRHLHCLGDVDGDGIDEIGVARDGGDNARYFVLDYNPITGDFVDLLNNQGGRDWGDSRGATSIAFGDVDGDGTDEIGVARNGGDNARYFVLDYNPITGDFVDLLNNQGGRDWGDSRGATSIAFGDVDGDGTDEIGVARNGGDNARYFVLDYNPITGDFVDLLNNQGGRDWGDSRGATSIAFGDVDGNGTDEIGVARNGGDNARYFVLDYNPSTGAAVDLLNNQGGRDWGDSRGATSIAFGDVDGDGTDEIGVARNGGDNARYFVLDYNPSTGAAVDLLNNQGGRDWGDSRGATSIAFGDVDGDGTDEIGVARNGGDNARYFVLDYNPSTGAAVDFLNDQGGRNWGDDRNATSIAFGDVDGNGIDEIGVARDGGDNARYFIIGEPT